jgi:hypothetical protein
MRSSLAPVLLVAVLGLGACTAPKSFVVVSMRSAESTPIRDVKEVEVSVKQGTTLSVTLTYPPPSGVASITIDQMTKTDLSVNFTGGQTGTVTMSFVLRNAAHCTVGVGSTTAVIKSGSTATTGVDIFPTFSCTDGGAPDAGGADGGVLFNGCDPVEPLCGGGKTCQVNCDTHMGECITGGTGGHGAACMKNNNCMPGTQCFDYAGAGCPNVKLCLRFCSNDDQCQVASGPADGGAGDGGGAGAAVGTRSVCAGPVQCGAITTGYRTCTFACDPRLTSLQSSGCPTGLSCLVVGSMDQVDCACPEKTRTGADGALCVTSSDCAPGYVCNSMGGAQKCRAVCRCDADGMMCKSSANDCADGKSCTALTNDTKFGVCL